MLKAILVLAAVSASAIGFVAQSKPAAAQNCADWCRVQRCSGAQNAQICLTNCIPFCEKRKGQNKKKK